MSIDEYPIDSNIGYYPGCVDYLDQEMIFSHVNEGSMNLGDATTSAFTLFEEMGEDVTYLGRDFEVLWSRPEMARNDRSV